MTFEKKMRYRIYTENVDLAVMKIQIVVNWHFPGCTIIHADGVYQGVKEKSLVIEIITETNHEYDKRIEKICKEINRIHQQECCMVTRENIDVAIV
jgi:predicted RNA-binding protein with PIN domain